MEPSEFNHYEDRRKRQKTLRLVVIEGVFSMIAIGLQQTFYIPFLNAMGATKLQIGLGAGTPAFVTAMSQFIVPALLRRSKGYKKLVLISIFSHAASYLPFVLIALLYGKWSVWLTIAALGVNAAAMGIGSSTWSDWMSYLVPRRRRGAYFAMRNRILTLVQLGACLLAGHFLDTFAGKTLLVFSLIWSVGFLTRFIGSWVMASQYEPPQLRQPKPEKGQFLDFVRRLHTHAFGRFTLAFSLLNFAANISGPFFAVYMINDLKLSYLKYTILTSIPSVMIVVTMSFWGKLCDRIGYVIPMRLFATTVSGLPLIWIITPHYWHLVLVQMVAGMAWGGMTMASFNYTLDAIGPLNRIRSISYLNVINYMAICLGSVTGGLLGPILPQFSTSQIHSIFLFSVILRFFPMLLFQTLPEDVPKHAKMSAMERFFFDPRLSLRNGLDRTIFGRDRRQF